MFELLNILKNCSDEEFEKIKSNHQNYNDVLDFVSEMLSDENHFFNIRACINMMCYFGLEKNKNIRVNDVGKYVMEKSILLKKKELSNNLGNMKLEITSFKYLKQVIKKMRENVKQTSQYQVLKNVLLFLPYLDIYWFINLITKKYDFSQKLYDLIKVRNIEKM